jgi:ornithine--oxo-acid transaminase
VSWPGVRGRAADIESYRAHVNPHRLAGFEALGWTETFVRAEGSCLIDAEGQRYLDMSACFGAAALGHHHPAFDAALTRAIETKRPGVMPFAPPEGVGELARRLCALCGEPARKVYFGNSGAEGIEAAMKFAMARTGRRSFVCFEGGYHGLTLGALGLTDGPWSAPWPALPFQGRRVPFGDVAAAERALETGDVAAVVTEAVQGVGGCRAWDGEALLALAAACRRRGTLLVLDEVLTGLGRTGAWFAFQKLAPDLRPDLVVASKALTGGTIPLCAVLMSDEVFEAVYGSPGCAVIHGSTFSANAMAITAGLSTIDIIEREDLVARAAALGTRLTEGVRALRDEGLPVMEVRGEGLLVGVRIAGAEEPDDALGAFACCHALRERRVVATVAAHAPSYLKLTPPLTLSEDELDTFLERLREALTSLVE